MQSKRAALSCLLAVAVTIGAESASRAAMPAQEDVAAAGDPARARPDPNHRCGQWAVPASFSLSPSFPEGRGPSAIGWFNAPANTYVDARQSGTRLNGTVVLENGLLGNFRAHGTAVGSLRGDALQLSVTWREDGAARWQPATTVVYSSRIAADGLMRGTAHTAGTDSDLDWPWVSSSLAACRDDLAAVLEPSHHVATAAAAGKPVFKLGRVQPPPGTPGPPERTVCEAARAARTRNSPAAPGLERQCLASGGSLVAPAPLSPEQRAAYVEAGARRSIADRLSGMLRARQAEGAGQEGYDIGAGVAGDDGSDGPGKRAIRETLQDAERAGYDAALAYWLDRNRNRDLADRGAAIDDADPTVATTRDASPDVFYRLGFDIATGLFGDPALGAVGNGAQGPGSQAIRDGLSPRAQGGFDASAAFHLARPHGP